MRMFFLLIAVSISAQAFSQSDFVQKPINSGMALPASKSVDIPVDSKFDFNKLPPKTSTYTNWDTPVPRNVDIIKKDEFVKPGEKIKSY